jgi:transcriptional regulator with AAA-type ATPase domain
MLTLENYAWQGNIRELENVIERLIVTRGSTLSGDGFLESAREGAFAGASLDDVQRGMKRGTLQFRMKQLGIRRSEAGVQV